MSGRKSIIMILGLALSVSITGSSIAQSAEICRLGTAAPDLGDDESLAALHASAPSGSQPHFGGHGQALIGLHTLYFSHLAVPMQLAAMHPHNFQIILEVAFESPAAHELYVAVRAEDPDALYTAIPQEFDQDALRSSEDLANLERAMLVRGHFEQGGTAIMPPQTMRVERVVYYHELIPDGEKLPTLQYLLFGSGSDLFAEHLISVPPDFQQIARMELDTEDSADMARLAEALEEGLFLDLPDRQNTPSARLREGETLQCELALAPDMPPVAVRLQVAAEQYCEEGELSRPVLDEFNRPQACAP